MLAQGVAPVGLAEEMGINGGCEPDPFAVGFVDYLGALWYAGVQFPQGLVIDAGLNQRGG
jgi:hypothetical protein